MSLPTLFVDCPWVQNPNCHGPEDDFYLPVQRIEVEVLTVHFQKRTMRVRAVSKEVDTGGAFDMDAEAFFQQFDVTPKG